MEFETRHLIVKKFIPEYISLTAWGTSIFVLLENDDFLLVGLYDAHITFA